MELLATRRAFLAWFKTARESLFWFGFGAIAQSLMFFEHARLAQTMPFANDNVFLTLPKRHFLAQSLASGNFPLWDPMSGLGAPFLSLYQGSGLSPLVLALASDGVYSSSTLVAEVMILNLLTFAGFFAMVRTWAHPFVAAISAASFALSPILVEFSRLNLEGLATATGLSWLAAGISLSWHGRKIGLFVSVVGTAFMISHGYLGMSYLVLLLMAFLALTHGVFVGKILTWNSLSLLRGLKWLALLSLLTIGVTLPLLTETLANWEEKRWFSRDINPFTASMRPESIRTLIDYSNIDVHQPTEAGGHWAILFVPIPVLIGLLGLLAVRPIFWAPSLAALVAFYLSLLPGDILVTSFFVDVIPGLSQVRFHAWGATFIVFGILVLASHGLQKLLFSALTKSDVIKICIAGMATVPVIVLFAFSSQQAVSSITSLALTAAMLLLARVRKIGSAKFLTISIHIGLFSVALATGALQQGNLANTSHTSPFDAEAQAAILGQSRGGYAYPLEGRREAFSAEPITNAHYFQGIQVVESYMPNQLSSVSELISAFGAEAVAPLLQHPDKGPVDYRYHWVDPNTVSLSLEPSVSGPVVVNLPFATGWHATVDGGERATEKADSGMLQLTLSPSDKVLTLTYRPIGLYMQMAVFICSWIVVIGGLVAHRPWRLTERTRYQPQGVSRRSA